MVKAVNERPSVPEASSLREGHREGWIGKGGGNLNNYMFNNDFIRCCGVQKSKRCKDAESGCCTDTTVRWKYGKNS
jgi:hypothetical protein